ncbi:hypothetical protein [Neobacillus notoginsengisoli]|uniref:hypothetical protein n=1 Tax=Neobacillus notoginsengisoli TaxID=1578198 RepID=UPI0026926652
MQKTFFSRRIRKTEMEPSFLVQIEHNMHLFNQAKHFVFQTLVREKRLKKKLHKKSIHLVVKQKFGLNDYYANSAVREARALFSSQEELQKLYIKQDETKITKLKKKLQNERRIPTQFLSIKDSLINVNLRFPKNLKYKLHPSGVSN